ncbi:GLPGLI family protein [Frigoriflavimonas asaccharolytica]|uniref:GLPGLI family protein n=1 Tax=Frigoriflavimonas asaccharolytica TaxID=2735899 RepID=A0A8J8G5Y0_9FLAO|nr:GLPGLI family protein [Frigoriflavimonas asaccharolytica]NRS91641.1 GLPGLI family protein [Frigoriflavimonas asaccharolytica]
MFPRFTFYFLFLFVSSLYFAQDLTIQYEYSKREFTDSTNIISQRSYLKIGKESSLFFSEAAYVSDSIMTENEKNGEKINFKNLPNDLIELFVRKKIKSKTLDCFSFEFIGHQYVYKESPNFKWKVTSTTKNILGKKVILAKTSYAGRDYEAYFAPEIPIQDGPYKFFGLPGLILEIYDTKYNHHFLAIGISTTSKIDVNHILEKEKFLEISKPKYLKLKEDIQQAPLNEMKTIMSQANLTERQDANGNMVNIPNLIKNMETKMIKEFERQNVIEKN